MKIKILIADDEKNILQTLKTFFQFHGYEVFTAEGGKEALEIFKRKKLDIALLDINMPGINGIELLERIKQKDFSTQVIMITGFSTFDKTLKSMEKGAVDYILKPIDDLNDVLKIVMESVKRLKRWKKNLSESVILAGKGY